MSAENALPRVKIGIRDSGVGGLTVARRVREALPDADLLYFADTAHLPYGDKSPAEVTHYALSICDFLLERGAQILVFACNTTSAYALDAARQRFSVPIFGVIEPGARVAAQVSGGKIGVLATAATVASGIYNREIARFNPASEVCEIGCPAFVPLVEAHKADSPEAFEACRYYLAPLLRFGADTVILGCTHYPLLLPALQKAAPDVHFVDPAQAVAREVAAHATPLPRQSDAKATFYVSGEREGVENWIRALLCIENPQLERGPVFDFLHSRTSLLPFSPSS
ncbi:MAG: glutamate racemase [Armatimonadetes bacterium]|nr:glutamate racemase [Armatimonadota bacterium]